MMEAIDTNLVFVGDGGSGCECCCPPPVILPVEDVDECDCCCPQQVYHSVWDRLCRQLFDAMPQEITSEDQLPNVDIWMDGIALADGPYPYTFIVASDGTNVPKPADIIKYRGAYYIIGTVEN